MITEIFCSIQGEGLYLGQKQIFVRFAHCNLDCDYCDEPKVKDKDGFSEQAVPDYVTIKSGTVFGLDLVSVNQPLAVFPADNADQKIPGFTGSAQGPFRTVTGIDMEDAILSI